MSTLDVLDGKLVYLAMPYSHRDPEVVAARMEAFTDMDRALIRAGVNTVSPLYKHFAIEDSPDIGTDWEYWSGYSAELMKRCDAVVIIKLPGWEGSTGVSDEIDLAVALKIPVYVISSSGTDLQLLPRVV